MNATAARQEPYPAELLDPGWAGELTDDELDYLKGRLKASASLRQRWGLPRRFSEAAVRKVALFGVGDGPKSPHPHKMAVFQAHRETVEASGGGEGRGELNHAQMPLWRDA